MTALSSTYASTAEKVWRLWPGANPSWNSVVWSIHCVRCVWHDDGVGPVRRRIRDVLASGRDERAFPSPSSPLVGGRLAQKIFNAWCSFVTVQGFLGEFIEIVLEVILIKRVLLRRSIDCCSSQPHGWGNTDTGTTGLPWYISSLLGKLKFKFWQCSW